MKFSTKGRYGLRAMVDMAANSNGEHAALYSIAQRQEISANYLEQVFSILRKSGLVKSVKGAQGGYILSDSPANIRVGDILRALEGELTIVDENIGNSVINKSVIEKCLRVNVWDKMTECISDIVDSVTLEDLTQEYRRMNGMENYMYYI
jgi:Rrf2 family transcriptional regulator, cysteine metabolism repressor